MHPMTVAQVAKVIGAEVIGEADQAASSVTIDSRAVKAGEVFFAIKGLNQDGHNFISEAEAKGASCAVIDQEPARDHGMCLLKTVDTTAALGRLAKHVRQACDYKVVAITGSAGKTTTRHITGHVLRKFFNCHEAIKSFNNHIGVPLTILGADLDSEILITELGSNNPGEIEALTNIVSPDIALITNIHPAHLEGFGSIDAIVKEKTSISAGLTINGKLIINAESAGLKEYCLANDLSPITFGKSKDCDIAADELIVSASSTTFKIEGIKVDLPLLGAGNAENALGAWAICKTIGISARQFAEAIKTIEPVEMRLGFFSVGKGFLLDDCYNSNPASMVNAMATLSKIAESKNIRAVMICGRMGELGSDSGKYHRFIGKKAAELQIPVVITVTGEAEPIAEEAKKAAEYDIQTEVFDNIEILCDNLDKFLKADDIILVKASRSEQFEKVSSKLKELLSK